MGWSLLLNRWVLIGIAFAVLAGWGWLMHAERDSARSALSVCRQEVSILGAKLKEQNDAVQQWQDEAAKAHQRGLQAQNAARVISQSHQAAIAALEGQIKAPLTLPEGDTTPVVHILSCSDALKELRDASR